MHRPRLGRMAGLLLSAGWLATLALALAAGRRPSSAALTLVALGVCTGLALSRRDWDRAPRRSLQLLVATAGLHALAAMIALDPSAAVSWPLFLVAAALAGGLLRRPVSVLVHAGVLADAAIVVAAVGPARESIALHNAAVLAPTIMLVAGAAAFLRARAESEERLARAGEQASAVHADLARRLAVDPDRMAQLTMGMDLQEGRGMGTAEGATLVSRIARALVHHDDPQVRATGAAALAERLGRVLAEPAGAGAAEPADRDAPPEPPEPPAPAIPAGLDLELALLAALPAPDPAPRPAAKPARQPS